ncbi:unnamed protein product [Arctia plantaginis]|uniref:Alkaline phosphatase n=1 Tax=Arctia plantaginis TaxID=874455 RepID=A0A8S0ZBR3_ARCPL|nr:unnamed protein product [Arctia plantaginis]
MSSLISCNKREYKNIRRQQGSTWCIVAVVMAVLEVSGALADRYHPVNPALRSATVPNAEELKPQYWAQQAEQAIKARSTLAEPRGEARNVILFLGDGMSVPTLAAARIYSGQQRGATGEETELFFESFPTTGLLKVGDSACTATAYLCGVKTNSGCIGVSAAVNRGDCAAARVSANQVQSIGEWALADGRDVGLVTTARVTHASPSGMYAKVPERAWENDVAVKKAGHKNTTCPDIAYQLVHMNPGNKFKVILGGGRRNFLPVCVIDEEGFRGIRKDGQNLIEDWQQSKARLNATYKYIWNRDQL